MLTRGAIVKFIAWFFGWNMPQKSTLELVIREVARRMKSEGPVTSHVIEIGINDTEECERKRGERTRLIAEAMFPGRETVLDLDATDYKAGKIVVLVAGIRQEEKAC